MSCNCKHEKITVAWLLSLLEKCDKEHNCVYHWETKDGKATAVMPNDVSSSKLKTVIHFIGTDNQSPKKQVRHLMRHLCLKCIPSTLMTFIVFLLEKGKLFNSTEGSYSSAMKRLLHLSSKCSDWCKISPRWYFSLEHSLEKSENSTSHWLVFYTNHSPDLPVFPLEWMS